MQMHFTMPRNPYHYNDSAVKLPGHMVAMATLWAAESFIVVLFGISSIFERACHMKQSVTCLESTNN